MFPLLVVFGLNEKWHKYGYILHRVWARMFFWLAGIRASVIYQEPLDKHAQYIFCPNHTSFLDIPTLGLNRNLFCFVGKSSLGNVPLFGYMYRKLHITVDRARLLSRYDTFMKCREALDGGKSLLIFPEGGIISPSPPTMSRFKDGPFRIAIEKQVPIVPATIPHNWIILPDDGRLLLDKKRCPVRLIFHSPIETKGMSLDDLPSLKERTYRIIQEEINKWQANGSAENQKIINEV